MVPLVLLVTLKAKRVTWTDSNSTKGTSRRTMWLKADTLSSTSVISPLPVRRLAVTCSLRKPTMSLDSSSDRPRRPQHHSTVAKEHCSVSQRRE